MKIKNMKNKTKILITILAVAVIAAALVWFLKYNKEYPTGGNISETNVAAGTVSRVEGGRFFITADVFTADSGFKKVERMIIINEATQIEKYNLARRSYEPVQPAEIKLGDGAQVYYTGSANKEILVASLVQLTGPESQMSVEELQKNLK